MEDKKVYEILNAEVNICYDDSYPRGWALYDNKIYFTYDEAYLRILELKEKFSNKTWAIRETTYLSLEPGIIKKVC